MDSNPSIVKPDVTNEAQPIHQDVDIDNMDKINFDNATYQF